MSIGPIEHTQWLLRQEFSCSRNEGRSMRTQRTIYAQWVPNCRPLVTIGHVENLEKCSMQLWPSGQKNPIGLIKWTYCVLIEYWLHLHVIPYGPRTYVWCRRRASTSASADTGRISKQIECAYWPIGWPVVHYIWPNGPNYQMSFCKF